MIRKTIIAVLSLFLFLTVPAPVRAEEEPAGEEAEQLNLYYEDLMYDICNGEIKIIYCDNSVTEVVIPDTIDGYPVTRIEGWAFSNCHDLKTIKFPETLRSIGEFSFYCCENLISIALPASVDQIENTTFLFCDSLQSFTVAQDNSAFVSVDGVLFSKDKKQLVKCPDGRKGSYTIPNTVTSVWEAAFHNCKNLTSITIPASVTALEPNVFIFCSSLNTITVASSSTSFSSVNGVLFSKNKKELVCCPGNMSGSYSIPAGVTTLWESAFFGCSKLTEIVFPESVTDIGVSAFMECAGLTDMVWPEGVDIIQSEMFKNCSILRSVTIPSVSAIEKSAFENCKKLDAVYFGGNCPDISDTAFDGCSSITAYYPEGDETWTSDRLKNYGADSISWRQWIPATGEIVKDVYRGKFFFTDIDKAKTVSEDCYYNDAFFSGDSWRYNHELAVMSLSMAMAAFGAYKPDDKSYNTFENYNINDFYFADTNVIRNTPAKNALQLMEECGFSDLSIANDYMKDIEYNEECNQGHNMGVCLGSKRLDKDTTLIAMALRGAGYGDEWIGNFTLVNMGTEHTGFSWAESRAEKALTDYIHDHDISGKIKVWLCGYSRAAATANLVAASLCRNEVNIGECTVAPEDVYAYTFETPRGTKRTDIHDKKYDGIWNIVNPIDPVPMLAMKGWKYDRFGHTLFTPCCQTNAKTYKSYEKAVLSLFNKFLKDDGTFDSLPRLYFQEQRLRNITDALASATGDESNAVAMVILDQLQSFFRDNSPDEDLSLDEDLSAVILKISGVLGGLVLAYPVLWVPYVLLAADLADIATYSAYAHYPQLSLAWMRTLPEDYFTDPAYQVTLIGRHLLINCPVDLAVYDSDGVLQLRVIDDEVFMEEDAVIEGYIDISGQKIICVPSDTEARIELTGTDSGTLNYSIQEYDASTDEIVSVQNYYDIPLRKGLEYTGTVSDIEEHEYTLQDTAEHVIKPDETLTGDTIKEYTLTLTSEGSGVAYGPANAVQGEFVKATALPDDGAEFLGWYQGEKKISDEKEYRLRMDQDTALTAKFSEADKITAFVSRLYKLCFNRRPDKGGLNNWVNKLKAKQITAAEAVTGFFNSKEMRNLKLSSDEFIERCYLVMMDRNSDAGGKKNWLEKAETGVSNMYILNGFVASREFGNICADFGIERGSVRLTEARDQNYGITQFISRCYSEVLGRKADTGGLNTWCGKIVNAPDRKKAAIETATTGFFHSREYLNMPVTNYQYILTLYRTFLGREADQGGSSYWMEKLSSGMSKDKVLMGFANSKEFSDIMAKYGIK